MTHAMGDAGGHLDPETNGNATNGSDPPKGPDPDHAQFLRKQGFGVIRPEVHQIFLKGIQVDSDNDLMIHRADQARRAPKEPRSSEQIWKESVRKYDSTKRSDAIAARYEYHRSQAVRLKTVMGKLVEEHESAAARYRQALGGDAA